MKRNLSLYFAFSDITESSYVVITRKYKLLIDSPKEKNIFSLSFTFCLTKKGRNFVSVASAVLIWRMVRCALRDLRVAACDRERDLRLGRNLRQKVSHTHTTTTITIITITKMHHLFEYAYLFCQV